MQFHSSLRESNLTATITITIGFYERSWFSYVDATQIITGIDSLILIEFAGLIKSLFVNFNWPVSQYELPRAVALASSACVNKTTKIITEVTRKDPFLHLKQANLSTAKGIIMKQIDLCYMWTVNVCVFGYKIVISTFKSKLKHTNV